MHRHFGLRLVSIVHLGRPASAFDDAVLVLLLETEIGVCYLKIMIGTPCSMLIVYTSAISRRRRIVDLVAAAAGVLEISMLDTIRTPWAIEGFGCEVLCPDLRNSPCTSRNGLLAASALPDADSLSLDCVLAAKCAYVAGVLCDFHLLYLLSQGGTVSVGIVSDGGSVIAQITRDIVVAIRRSLRLRR